MTIHEMRVCYPNYAAKERELEQREIAERMRIDTDARLDSIKKTVSDARYQLGRDLGPVTGRSDTDAQETA